MRACFRLAIGGCLALALASQAACTGSDPVLDASGTERQGDGGAAGANAPPDSGADASTEGTETHVGPVTVTVRRRSTGRLDPSESVLFYDAKGNVLAYRATNDVGQTSFEHPDIAAVTLSSGTSLFPRFMTFLGVQAGDSLQWVDDDYAGEQVSFKVYAPPSQPAGTTLRLVLGSCSETVTAGGAVSPPFDRTCIAPGASRTPFLVAMNGTSPVASTSLRDVNFNESSGITVLQFSDAWANVSPPARTLTATGLPTALPPGTSSAAIGLTHQLGADRGTMVDVTQKAVPSGATLPFALQALAVPNATFRQDELTISANLASPSGAFLTRALAVRGPVTTDKSVELAQTFPTIRSVTVTGGTVPTVAFDADTSIAATKGLVAVARWTISDTTIPDAVGAWRIVGPPSASTLTPPPLPPAYQDLGPSDPGAWRAPFLASFDGSAFKDYAAFRCSNVPGDALTSLVGGVVSRTLPVLVADGAATVTALGNSGY